MLLYENSILIVGKKVKMYSWLLRRVSMSHEDQIGGRPGFVKIMEYGMKKLKKL